MSPERLRALIEATSDWIWEIDEKGIYTFSSHKVCDLLGYEVSEVIGRSPFDFMPPEERRRVGAIFAEISGTRLPVTLLENTNIHKDGRLVVLETSAVPLFREDGSYCGYRGIDRDVTRRKQAELELTQAKEAAEEASRAKDDFLARISHELRTPLSPILNAVDVLEEAQLPQELQEYIRLVRRNVEMEARLVDDLLDISRIVQGKTVLRPEKVDAHQQVSHAVQMCQADLEAKEFHLHVKKEAAQSWVEVDVTRFQQALLNVIRNAIKFTPAMGTITILTRNPTPSDFEVVVSDTGIGISPNTLKHLFRAFEQGGREVTRQFGGLGLGLAITRTLMELHGGSIAGQSDGPNKGATFTLRLPTVSAPHETAAAPPRNAPWQPCRILLVDDNTDTLKVLAHLLHSRGHTVHTATSVAEAQGVATNFKIDLLISDLGLPDGSGIDLMRQLRMHGISRGIAFSGYGMDSDIQKSRDAGFLAHLTKPVDIKVLMQQIEAAMREHGGISSGS